FDRGIDHADVHPVRGLVHTRRVDEHHLRVGKVLRTGDPGASGLGFVGDDRELLPEDAIEECGLTRVGTAKKRDEAGLHGSYGSVTSEATSRRRARTLVIRRRSTSSTSNDRPSISIVSPTYGIRPSCDSR